MFRLAASSSNALNADSLIRNDLVTVFSRLPKNSSSKINMMNCHYFVFLNGLAFWIT